MAKMAKMRECGKAERKSGRVKDRRVEEEWQEKAGGGKTKGETREREIATIIFFEGPPRLGLKQQVSCQQLKNDTTHRPHVDCLSVLDS
jgi:hypothetical protein